MSDKNSSLRFDGSVWCNLDVALRNVDQIFRQEIKPEGLTVIEWYILRALYDSDGRHASELARAVGRAATSFTPNLDKLQDKGYIERRPDKSDRRAVRIYLTKEGSAHRENVLNSAKQIDQHMKRLFNNGEYEAFQSALVTLQAIEVEE